MYSYTPLHFLAVQTSSSQNLRNVYPLRLVGSSLSISWTLLLVFAKQRLPKSRYILPSSTGAASAKINISYSILFNLTTSYSSYFGGKKGISRNKTSFFLLMWN